MKAFFIDGDMRLVEVNGNVLVVYYPVEEKDSSLIMMNYSEGWTFENVLEGEKNGARSLCWKDYRYSLSFGPDSTR